MDGGHVQHVRLREASAGPVAAGDGQLGAHCPLGFAHFLAPQLLWGQLIAAVRPGSTAVRGSNVARHGTQTASPKGETVA